MGQSSRILFSFLGLLCWLRCLNKVCLFFISLILNSLCESFLFNRFPYLVLKNGGGAFLIPFIIAMVVAGGPLFYLEILLGQFSGRSPAKIWELSPAFRGLGYSMSLLSVIAALYYMPFTWSTLYLVSIFDYSTFMNNGTEFLSGGNYSTNTSLADEFWK